MSLIKDRTCSVCGKKYLWKIERPSDGYWDRWKNDDGEILANWFITNNLCWDHAFEKMPEKYRAIIRTVHYEESVPAQQTQTASS